MGERAKLRIFRFDESRAHPSYTDYEVPMAEVTTVLQALFYIRDHYDDVPAFRRYQCNRGQCCSCLMTINHRPRRACVTKVEPEMVLEPLKGYPIIRDLVVDYGSTNDGYFKRNGTALEWAGNQLKAVPRYHLEIDPDFCTGCELCVQACPKNHRENVQTRYGEEVAGEVTLVLKQYLIEAVRFCHQCDPAACLDVCPLDALARDPGSGAVVVNEEKCIACGLCLNACPYENIVLYMERGKALKCDLCLGQPECVAACPEGAIQVVGQHQRF